MGLIPVAQARGQVSHPIYRGPERIEESPAVFEIIKTQVCGDQAGHYRGGKHQAQAQGGFFDE